MVLSPLGRRAGGWLRPLKPPARHQLALMASTEEANELERERRGTVARASCPVDEGSERLRERPPLRDSAVAVACIRESDLTSGRISQAEVQHTSCMSLSSNSHCPPHLWLAQQRSWRGPAFSIIISTWSIPRAWLGCERTFRSRVPTL